MAEITREEAAAKVARLTPFEREWLECLTRDDTRMTAALKCHLSKSREDKIRTIVSAKLGRLSLTGCAYVLGLADGGA